MRDLDLKTLRLFVAVCDHHNIAQAAEEENIEPSAISKRIARLEDDLRTQLLVRSRRGVETTATGAIVLEHARSILFATHRLWADASAFGQEPSEHVSISASASVMAESLMGDVSAFMREPANRHIRVNVEERLSSEIIRQLRAGAVAVGICWDQADLHDLETCPYRQDFLALAVPAGHSLAHRTSVSFEETLDFDHVGLLPTTAVHTMLRRTAAQAGKPLSYRVVVSSFDAAFRVVSAGLGLSVVPREVAETYRTALGVEIIPLTNAWAQRRFVICYRRFDGLQKAAQRLVNYLKGRAKTEPADAGDSAPGRGLVSIP